MNGKRKGQRGDLPDIPVSIRLTPSQHEWLKLTAARENRTVSQQVRHIIEAAQTKQ